MTVGEMLEFTKRFKEIMDRNSDTKDERLANLMTDLELAYEIPALNDEEFNKKNPFVMSLYRAVSEARSL